ncbi:MAG TPA: ISAs1 family transposase [Thiobacillaceae bacterium]|nr:ISAs1 family transposase [Thiobacillaceae bacterium]
MSAPKFRQPVPEEQQVLQGLTVRPIQAHERRRYDQLIKAHHYLHTHQLVGEQLCYVATFHGQWLALSSWCAAARHIKGRDQFIGWTPEQCRSRRALVANNARFLILPGHHLPNLASRVMKLVLERLSDDWLERFKHPIVLVESFVDPEQFRGTTYQCSGWSQLGLTQGYGRQSKDFYIEHAQPKQLWVKTLVRNATVKLRAEHLPEAWAVVEQKIQPRCTAKSAELKSLTDHLARIPEYRSAHALGYPLAGLLCLIAVATFAGVVRGKKDLAAFAATLSQHQMRALRFRRRDSKSKKLTPPGVTTFFRILNEVDERALELALLAWQDQILGPVQDRIIAIDGKKLRHSQGGELVSAVGAQTGRWLGTVRTPDKTNEIRAARTLLEHLNEREPLTGKVVVLDALHTNMETARLIVQDLGADYLFTVKANQDTLHKTVSGLLSARAFSPSRSHAQCPDTGVESGTSRTPIPPSSGHHTGTGELCGSTSDRGAAQQDAQEQEGGDRPDLAPDHERRSR